MCGTSFMQQTLEMTYLAIFDWFHRQHNDLQHSTRQAGMWSIYYQTILVFNVGHGPWAKGAWFHQILESATDLKELLNENDRMLKVFWPKILVDKSLHFSTLPDEVGPPARRKFIQELPLNRCFVARGSKTATSKWHSWRRSFDEWDEELNTRCLALVNLCIEKGGALAAEDLFNAETWHASISLAGFAGRLGDLF